MQKFQCSLIVVCRYSLRWSRNEVSKNGSEIHELTIKMLKYFCVAIARIYARLFTHYNTMPLEWGMKWMSSVCVSRIISILILTHAIGTTIWFLDEKRLEKISLVCAHVKTLCTLQQRGVLSVLLHKSLMPRTPSTQSQFTLKFLMASNSLKEVISLFNSLNSWGVVVCSIKGDVMKLTDNDF